MKNKSILLLALTSISLFAGPLDSGKLEFTSTIATSDGTTNLLTTIACPTNRVIRVEARVLGIAPDGTYGCSFGKVITVRNDGTNSAWIGSSVTIATARDFSKFECVTVADTNGAKISVAGDTDKPLNWTAYVTVFYSTLTQ